MKFEVEQSVNILQQTPDTLISLLDDLSDDWTLEKTDPEVWSAFDVIGHLIHGEETDWIPRAKIILEQGANVTFEPFDRFAQFENSKGKTLRELLDKFKKLRRENIRILRGMNLSGNDFNLKGIHPELGEVTLEQLLSTWVVHDLNHIRQIVVGLASKYSENVGAWKQYLAILR